ncbi:MAG: elongation factor P [Kiritimatiellia bacterium]|jgi:elongation factor P
MYETSEIKNGLKIEMDDHPYTVTYFQFVKPGKGTAFTRTKLKSLLNGNVLDRTFRTGEKLVEADIEEKSMQYLYDDGTGKVFMDNEDYDQITIETKVLGDTAKWLVEEMSCNVLFWRGSPINVDLPNFVVMEIVYCEPGVKGNTATGAVKSAELTSGATVNVPLFVEQGENIKIDTRTGSYVERVRN